MKFRRRPGLDTGRIWTPAGSRRRSTQAARGTGATPPGCRRSGSRPGRHSSGPAGPDMRRPRERICLQRPPASALPRHPCASTRRSGASPPTHGRFCAIQDGFNSQGNRAACAIAATDEVSPSSRPTCSASASGPCSGRVSRAGLARRARHRGHGGRASGGRRAGDRRRADRRPADRSRTESSPMAPRGPQARRRQDSRHRTRRLRPAHHHPGARCRRARRGPSGRPRTRPEPQPASWARCPGFSAPMRPQASPADPPPGPGKHPPSTAPPASEPSADPNGVAAESYREVVDSLSEVLFRTD